MKHCIKENIARSKFSMLKIFLKIFFVFQDIVSDKMITSRNLCLCILYLLPAKIQLTFTLPYIMNNYLTKICIIHDDTIKIYIYLNFGAPYK